MNNYYLITNTDWDSTPEKILEKYPKIITNFKTEIKDNMLFVRIEDMEDLENFRDSVSLSLVFGYGLNGYYIKIYDGYME